MHWPPRRAGNRQHRRFGITESAHGLTITVDQVPVGDFLDPAGTRTSKPNINVSHQPALVEPPLNSIWGEVALIVLLVGPIWDTAAAVCVGSHQDGGPHAHTGQCWMISFPLVLKRAVEVIELTQNDEHTRSSTISQQDETAAPSVISIPLTLDFIQLYSVPGVQGRWPAWPLSIQYITLRVRRTINSSAYCAIGTFDVGSVQAISPTRALFLLI
jgi:hypothetical protein